MADGVLIDARTFLGNVWKLSAPYWRSEEKWRAWGLLARDRRAVAQPRLHAGAVQRLEPPVLQRARAEGRARLLRAARLLLLARRDLHRRSRSTRPISSRCCRCAGGSGSRASTSTTGSATRSTTASSSSIAAPTTPTSGSRRTCGSSPPVRLTLGLGVMREIVTLASFAVILWDLSGSLPLRLGGTEVTIPGYLVWVALVYAIVGSALTYSHRPLAHPAQLPAGAARSRFPLRARPPARERRGRRPVPRRSGREPALQRAASSASARTGGT